MKNKKTQISENVLNSCPFCGGYAELTFSDVCGGHGFYLRLCYVSCVSCGARGPSVDDYNGPLNTSLAVNKWNNRKGCAE